MDKAVLFLEDKMDRNNIKNIKFFFFALAAGFFTAAVVFRPSAINNIAFGIIFTIAGIAAIVMERRVK